MDIAENFEILEKLPMSHEYLKLDVMIIGAGMSGLMAAHQLQHAGVRNFRLFDKGKSPGGRLATRRIGSGRFDHGAQFMTAHTSAFQSLLEQWMAAEWIFPWYHNNHVRYAASDGMSRLAKQLAQSIPVSYSSKVEQISHTKDGYRAHVRNQETEQVDEWVSQSVIMTSPLPQTLDLLDKGMISLPEDIRNLLESVQYAPCIGLLLLLRHPIDWVNGHLYEPIPGLISWVANNQQKGISESTAITIHLNASWSKEHYKDEDDRIFTQLMPALESLFGDDVREQIIEQQIKRWKYAQAHSMIEAPFITVGTDFPLILAGDAFGGSSSSSSKIEHAVLSGQSAGQWIAKQINRTDGG